MLLCLKEAQPCILYLYSWFVLIPKCIFSTWEHSEWFLVFTLLASSCHKSTQACAGHALLQLSHPGCSDCCSTQSGHILTRRPAPLNSPKATHSLPFRSRGHASNSLPQSRPSLCPAWTVDCQVSCPWNFCSKNARGLSFLFARSSRTQIKPVLHCSWFLTIWATWSNFCQSSPEVRWSRPCWK